MATFVIYAAATDGYNTGYGTNYANARAGSGSLLANTVNNAFVGQTFLTPTYYIYEAALSFDTSGVTGVVDSAVLSLYVAADESTTDFTINARAYDWGAGLTTADWVAGASLSGNPLRASRSSAGITVEAYNDLTSDGSFISNLTSPVRLLLSSDRTEAGTTPTGPEDIGFYSADESGTTKDPKLTIITDVTTSKSGSDSGTATDASELLKALLLSPVITESFTDTTGTPLESHAPSSGAWTHDYGTPAFKINASGRAYLDNSTGAAATSVYGHSASFVDGSIEGDVIVQSGDASGALLALRFSYPSPFNYYNVVVDNGGNIAAGVLRLNKVVAGTETHLDTYTVPGGFGGLSGSNHVKLEVVGTSLKVWLDGELVITATDSSLSSAGRPALSLTAPAGAGASTSLQFDNVVITNYQLAERVAVTEGASVDTGVGAKSAAETVSATDASAVKAAPLPHGASGPRSPYGSSTVLFPSNGVAGTFGAHYAFPDGATLPDGTRVVVCRKGINHSTYDGDFVIKKKPPGGAWSSEATIFPGGGAASDSGAGVDWRMMDLRVLASGRLAAVAYKRTGSLAAYPGGDRFFPVFTYCEVGLDPTIAANWSTPVAIATSATVADWTATSDILEMPNGDLIVATYGTPSLPWTLDRCDVSKSTNGGTSWTYLGTVDDGSGLPLSSSAEVQLELIPGTTNVLATFRTLSSPWEMYGRISTDGCATWGARFLIASNSINRTGLVCSPDGDLVATYNEGGTALKFKQSYNGSTFGSAVSAGGQSANVFSSPFNIAGVGVTPNMAIAYANEYSSQTLSDVSYMELTASTGSVTLGETPSVIESASVGVLSSAIPKTASDAAAAADAASVAALTPAIKAGAETAAAADASSVSEIDAPVVIQAGSYDLRLGRIRLPTLLDQLKERVGEQLETVGATAIAGERRAKGMPLNIPIHATGMDGKTVADRMRRQVRALIDNPAARLGAIYLAFTPDPELSAWLLVGDGDLAYAEGGIVFGDYELELSDAYVVARQRSHLPARRVEVLDRRLATTPRDIKGTIYSTDFASVTPSAVTYLPGASRYLRRGIPYSGTPVASVLALMGSGTPQLASNLADGDVIVLDGIPDDTHLQNVELGDVIVLDRQAVAASTVTPARDITPQSSYGWEELYGPNQPISYPAGVPSDLVVQNGVCRVTCASNGVLTVDQLTAAGFTAACSVAAVNPLLSTLYLRDANIVYWTPDETVVRFQLDNTQANPAVEAIGRCELYVTLRRGWDAPRVEAYFHTLPGTSASSATIRLRVLHAIAGTTALATSTTGSSNITDGTAYGTFSARDPWLGLTPSSGPVILAAVTRATDKIAGRVVGSLKGVEVYDDSASVPVSYASVQLSITTAGAASTYGPIHAQRCMADVRTIPTFLPR